MIKSSTQHLLFINFMMIIAFGCSPKSNPPTSQSLDKIKLITLDPGHFHAALVQKSMYENVDSLVHIYAPEGQELQSHLNLVNGYNSRVETPTFWKSKIYKGPDFLDKMLAEKTGNVLVLAGNNQMKTDYILKSVDAGLHVLADKPMAIDLNGFNKLVNAFEIAAKNKVLLYDIMTERYEINTMLQKEFAHLSAFGELEKGSPENPSVTKVSVHHFFKNVSGKPLVRPTWFFDVKQQGEGITDITTHLVDLVQWECFPNQILDYKKDIEIVSAKRWQTDINAAQFEKVTQQKEYPEFLKSAVKNGILSTYSNGEINYRLKGIHAKISVTWDFQAPEGTGDTHFSVMRGTKASVIIKQGKEQNFKPALYIEPRENTDMVLFERALMADLKQLQKAYPGLELKKLTNSWEVIIPDIYKVSHEDHFAQVTKKYLQFLKEGRLPAWEVPNMIAKYYTTTKAREIALGL
jgi:predicted dehydrogenase